MFKSISGQCLNEVSRYASILRTVMTILSDIEIIVANIGRYRNKYCLYWIHKYWSVQYFSRRPWYCEWWYILTLILPMVVDINIFILCTGRFSFFYLPWSKIKGKGHHIVFLFHLFTKDSTSKEGRTYWALLLFLLLQIFTMIFLFLSISKSI